nr:glycosyltransferase family 39 protein [Chloroflexota bacterium]
MSTLATWARFPEDDLALPAVQQSRTRFGREPWIGGICATLIYGLLGVLIVPRYGVMTDAFARVANAFYVVFSRDPHLEAIGFVWNPLPSMLMVPLVLLKGIWPALVREAIAANLISALFGGIGMFYMLRILRRLGLSGRLRWTIAILFALNPAMLFYAVNGLTDVMMGTTLLAATDGLWAYLEEGSFSELLASGVWVAVGFLIRYEVVVWAGLVGVALAYGLARLPVRALPAQRRADWIAGLLLFWLTPLVCVVITWIFYNWIIMGDPLYFMRSTYGNEASVATGAYAYGPMNAARHSIGGTFAYLGRQTLLFPPVTVVLVALLLFGLKGRLDRHVRALILVAAAVAVPLLQVLLLYRGDSPGWLRFFLSF